jgi:hypothetical protein
VQTTKKINKETIEEILIGEKTHDYIDYSPSSKILTITRNPFGFKNKVKKESGYQGVSNQTKDESGNNTFETDFISDEDFERKIISILKKNDIEIIPEGIKVQNKKALPVVKPGTQTRRFTHVKDTVNACLIAWGRNRNKHYSVASNKSYSIIQLAKLFNTKIKYLPKREGERFSSTLTSMNFNNKIIRLGTKIKLQDYIKRFLRKNL